jgi:hypothetical protein
MTECYTYTRKRRIKPVQDRFVLRPAAGTHMRRGNPCLLIERMARHNITRWSEYGV